MRRFDYIDSVGPSVARKICKFVFGDYFFRLIKNNKDLTFDVYLQNGVDIEDVNYFKNYFGKRYKIFIIDKKELEYIGDEN